jgi:hypothetical protein
MFSKLSGQQRLEIAQMIIKVENRPPTEEVVDFATIKETTCRDIL